MISFKKFSKKYKDLKYNFFTVINKSGNIIKTIPLEMAEDEFGKKIFDIDMNNMIIRVNEHKIPHNMLT